jgi:histidine triad (HIT) family protein
MIKYRDDLHALKILRRITLLLLASGVNHILKHKKEHKTMDDCLFCKIIARKIPAKIVYEDEHALAFHDINPQAPLHLLVIPKAHYAALHEVPHNKTGIITNLFLAVNKVVEQNKCVENSYRLVVNFGSRSGQTVSHIHVHILSGRDLKSSLG